MHNARKYDLHECFLNIFILLYNYRGLLVKYQVQFDNSESILLLVIKVLLVKFHWGN